MTEGNSHWMALFSEGESALRQGNYQQAEEALRQAVTLCEIAPEHDYELPLSLKLLATACARLGKANDAEETFSRALHAFEENYGPFTEDFINTALDFMDFYSERSDPEGAQRVFERYMADAEDEATPAEDDDPPAAALRYAELATRLHERKHYRQARDLFERALSLLEAEDEREVASDLALTLSNYGELLKDVGEGEAAESNLRRALAMYEAIPDPNLADWQFAISVLIDMLEDTGRQEEADTLREKLLEIQEQIADEEVPYQLTAFFDEFPTLDPKQLESDIENFEPEAPPCEVGEVKVQEKDEFKIGSFPAIMGRTVLAVLVHNVPCPDEATMRAVESMPLQDDEKAKLLDHQAFALVNCIDTESEPIEKLIAMMKLAFALVKQGATGIAMAENWNAFPAKLVREFANYPFWGDLRQNADPVQLFVRFLPVRNEKGEAWCLSKGHTLFGLPELAYRVEDPDHEDLESIESLFQGIFSYMFQHGPVIHAGNTMEVGDQFLRFREPSEDEEDFFDSATGTLVLSIGAS